MASKTASVVRSIAPAKQLEGFIAKYDKDVGKLARSARTAVRKRLPTANELVYDNYQFLAIGYSGTERTSDCIVSLAVSPKGVALSFYYGASLSDPHGVLLGSGNQNRFIRLASAATLNEPAVAALIDAAVAQSKTPLPAKGRGQTIIKSISAKQRPRRRARRTSSADLSFDFGLSRVTLLFRAMRHRPSFRLCGTMIGFRFCLDQTRSSFRPQFPCSRSPRRIVRLRVCQRRASRNLLRCVRLCVSVSRYRTIYLHEA